MMERPILMNYYLAKPATKNAKNRKEYAHEIVDIANKVKSDLDEYDIPLISDHGLLMHHGDLTDKIPEADDVNVLAKKDEWGAFLKSEWRTVWTGSQVSFDPSQPLAMKTKPVTMGEVKAHLTTQLPSVGTVEMCPHHEPRLDAHYLRGCDTYDTSTSDGSALDGLLDLLNANTDEDKALMKALILSAFWGGPYGTIPLMVLRAPHGPGSGKSETVKILEALVGGGTWVSPSQDQSYEKAITRSLGTPSEAIKRLVVLDNVETGSSGLRDPALASFITGSTLPLDRLYSGAYQPPNNKLWTMTLNSQKFSQDLASRSVIIDVGPPPRTRSQSDEWDDPIPNFTRTWMEYIDPHREAIITDCLAILRGADKVDLSGVDGGRWSQWAYGVLAKLKSGDDLWETIIRRQSGMDQQSSEAQDIVDELKLRLRTAGIDPDDTNVCIPTRKAQDWLGEHFGEDHAYSARRFWSHLSVYPKTKPFQRYGLEASSGRDSKHRGGMGLVWRGDPSTSTVLDWETAKTDKPIMERASIDDDDGSDDGGHVCDDCGTVHDTAGDMMFCCME